MTLRLLLPIISLLCLIVPFVTAAPFLALPGCRGACGNVSIPYPFGIGTECYFDERYAISCNLEVLDVEAFSVISWKPFLSAFNLEVLDVDLNFRLVTLNIPNGTANSKCPGQTASTVWNSTNFKGSPFHFSRYFNEFTVVGCDKGLLDYAGEAGKITAGCTPECIDSSASATNGSTEACNGIDCCQISIPADLDAYEITISGNSEGNCTYAFIAQINWYTTNNLYAINEITHVPVAMNWLPPVSLEVDSPRHSCSYYGNLYIPNCSCQFPYEGNPYLPGGCTVIEACASCEKECDIRRSGRRREYYCNRSNKTEIILGTSLGGGLLMLFLCGFCFWLYKYMMKRRIMKLKKKFFKRNGGLLLQQQISSDEGMVEKTIVFTSQELEKATDNFNENRILGRGGQGTVYKGMLTDGKIVAIKKSKVVDASQLESFINEVVILSQINHRNIVKLLGCCLETEVPLLVYEFVPNGNLFQLVHDQNEEFQLSWKMRLQIATEVAGALAYLHSASSIPVYHRDIKSTNILLDDKYRAKVADFGTSRSISIEQTHLTTVVQGTFGYLDPEYFQSSQFTEKSDVYSYGVVLVELLTGQKAISSIVSDEERSLATRFILSLKEMRLFNLLDPRVVQEARQEEIDVVADIAKRCLSLSGKKRPTMREVMVELEGIRMSHMPQTATQNFHEEEYFMEMNGPIDTSLTSTQSNGVYRRALSSNVDPLLANIV